MMRPPPALGLLASLWGVPLVARATEPEPNADEPEVEAEADTTESAQSEPAADAPTTPAPEPAEPEWLELNVPVDFGSAISTGLETQAAAGALPAELAGLVPAGLAAQVAPSSQPRRRFGVRPLLGLSGVRPGEDAQGHTGGEAGLRISHLWWTLPRKGLRPAGETRLQATGIFGGVQGYDLVLDTAAGTWWGPVGVFVGGRGRADRRATDAGVVAAPGIGVGPTSRVALHLGPVVPWIEGSAAWIVGGTRTVRSDVPIHEPGAAAGVVIEGGFADFRLGSTWRQLDTGQLWSASLGMHIRI